MESLGEAVSARSKRQGLTADDISRPIIRRRTEVEKVVEEEGFLVGSGMELGEATSSGMGCGQGKTDMNGAGGLGRVKKTGRLEVG